MTSMLPYLAVDRGAAGCVEVLNNARTLAYIGRASQPRPAPSWQLTSISGCDQNACAEFNTADYTWPHDWAGNPAPWADPARPASWEFFGLLADTESVQVEPAWSQRRRGDTLNERATYSPRVMTITGTIISSTARGTAYGEEWLVRQLRGDCSATFVAKVLRHCPDPSGVEFTGWTPLPLPFDAPTPVAFEGGPVVVWDDGTPLQWSRPTLPGIDPCGDVNEAEPLPALPDAYVPPPLPDPGWRDLYGCRFVSLDFLDDEPMDPCEGRRIVIVIEITNEGTWFPSQDQYGYVQLIDQAFNLEVVRGFEVPEGPVQEASSCGVCGLPCRCSNPDLVVDTWPLAMEGCYREPLASVPMATLTPVLPWSVEAGVVIDITGGTDGLENVSVRVYEALDGIPNPITVLGCRIYSQHEPCAEALIAGIPSGSTLTLDGRLSRVLLSCPGREDQPGEHLALGSAGRPFRHPRLGCGRRYWVVIEADWYYVSADANVRVRYVPFEAL